MVQSEKKLFGIFKQQTAHYIYTSFKRTFKIFSLVHHYIFESTKSMYTEY